jgi:SIR2-like protein
LENCEFSNEWLQPLAEMLIARHIKVSVPDHELRGDLFERDPDLWDRCRRKFRCIAVVGAGASAPVLARGDDLASGLIEKFNIGQASVEAEKERLARITAVDPTEFEAQLSAIGQTLGNSRRVRAAISDLYRVRHPSVLAYEMLAHLLKHRFLDAIISMNFDELLDQSLDDELGVDEYTRIVSDRDCVNVNSDVSAPDYMPLYIKLHGTASEPESLRFTRESYYDSPVQVGTEAARLFQTPECVVLNIGFGMASFDLHRLLAIPDRLSLYNLSHAPLSRKARKAIKRERQAHGRLEPEFVESSGNETKRKREKKRRKKAKKQREQDAQHPPKPLWIFSPDKSEEELGAPSSELASGASDQMMDALFELLEDDKTLKAESSPIALHSVTRHRVVAGLLGPNSRPGKRLIELPRNLQDRRMSLDPLARAARPDAVKAGYLLRRTILELALAMARGRGLVSIATLAIDRCGLYYDDYCRHAGPGRVSWQDLYRLVGFRQDEEIPDVLEAIDELRIPHSGDLPEEATLHKTLLELPGDGRRDEWHELPRLDVERLRDRVLPHIVDSPSSEHEVLLLEELEAINTDTEYELHSRDDRVCSKTFSAPIVLKTLSSLDAYSFDLVQRVSEERDKARREGEKPSEARLEIISETGDWLLHRNEIFKDSLKEAGTIRLIVAFLGKVPELYEKFPQIEIKYQQPWHHNRHMVILRTGALPRSPDEDGEKADGPRLDSCEGSPERAIYFARHHRTPYVTPVLLKRIRDIEILGATFKDRWTNALWVSNPDEQS